MLASGSSGLMAAWDWRNLSTRPGYAILDVHSFWDRGEENRTKERSDINQDEKHAGEACQSKKKKQNRRKRVRKCACRALDPPPRPIVLRCSPHSPLHHAQCRREIAALKTMRQAKRARTTPIGPSLATPAPPRPCRPRWEGTIKNKREPPSNIPSPPSHPSCQWS